MVVTGSFDPVLVAFSIVIATVASYTSLELARRVAHTTGLASIFWLVAGAMSMGIGIWTMHFVGMLAFSMDMPFSYDVSITALSLLVGVVASAFALYIGSQKNVGKLKIGLSGIVLGCGIASMHYTGMAAMKMQAIIHYNPILFSASIVIAVIAATAAIWIAFTLSNTIESGLIKIKFFAAGVMGLAICGMHYIGMLAASYELIEDAVMSNTDTNSMPNSWLAMTLGIAAIMILGVTLLILYFDCRLASQKQSRNHAEQKAIQLGEILDDSLNEIYLFDADTLRFLRVNKGAQQNLGYSAEQLESMTPVDLIPEFTFEAFNEKIRPLRDGLEQELRFDSLQKRADGSTYPVNVHLQLSTASSDYVFVATIIDITERLELEYQISQSNKLESIGQLAAGIAHEVNTPTQYIGDNTRFLEESFNEINPLLKVAEELATAVSNGRESTDLAKELIASFEEADVVYLKEEIPRAIGQTLDGVEHVRKIVQSMKEFSHPGGKELTPIDLNHAIDSTLIVATNEWKYVAELETDFDEELPPVPCQPSEINQVVLNMIVNASHAIADVVGNGASGLGTITVATRLKGEFAEIRISDTGSGIPEDARGKIFDPFFTTKEVGKGSGQGLSIAHGIIVKKHGGILDFETEMGKGTTFIIHLPLNIASEHYAIAS